MRWLPVLFAAGCATATSDSAGTVADSGTQGQLDGSSTQTDAAVTTPDAPVGPMTRTLTQTTSQAIKAVNSIACANNTNGTTRANSYYRVFDLAAAGITSEFTVSKVSFQVEHCDKTSGSGTCASVAVRVGTYNGTPGTTLTNANITILASNATVAIPEVIETTDPPSTPGGTVDAPLTATIPAGQKLLVQVDAPDGNGAYSFYMGTNDGGESAPGYILSSTCSINAPTSISTVGTAAARHLLLTVTGTY